MEEKKWTKYHQSPKEREALPPLVQAAWQESCVKRIDPDKKNFHAYPPDRFEQIKKDSVVIYAYANRFILQMLKYNSRNCLGFAVFDQNACLLKLYGSAYFMQWCRQLHIQEAAHWHMDYLGANAISIGINHNKPVAVCGSENFSRLLLDTAIYFSPISLEDKQGLPVNYGGIALIVPFSERNEDYLMMAVALTKDVALHLYMANNLNDMFFMESRGLLSIDINMRNNKPSILYHNKELFHVLEIPNEDLYYQPVTRLIDPLPDNQVFWDILNNNRKVTQEQVPLSIKGEENTYTVSTDPYLQTDLAIRGIRFFITSPRQISMNVSKKIGNNAIRTFPDIIGNDAGFLKVINHAKAISRSNSNVIILGESGVGKDVFAQAIHNVGPRQNNPFIAVNCAAFPRELIASELFGYDGGAYTGSKKNGNIGKFELANTGTIFLDEIGDMPLDLQAMLLRVIEQKKFMRLGSNVTINVDVKIISATNADLKQLVDQKKFRADLYYRLSTLKLTIPPLRERGDDVILLAEHFIHSISARIQKPIIMKLSERAKTFLKQYSWKGNVRELGNVFEAIVQLSDAPVIEPEHILEYISEPSEAPVTHEPVKGTACREMASREMIEEALKNNRYNKTDTAKALGISRKTLYRWMDDFNI